MQKISHETEVENEVILENKL